MIPTRFRITELDVPFTESANNHKGEFWDLSLAINHLNWLFNGTTEFALWDIKRKICVYQTGDDKHLQMKLWRKLVMGDK